MCKTGKILSDPKTGKILSDPKTGVRVSFQAHALLGCTVSNVDVG